MQLVDPISPPPNPTLLMTEIPRAIKETLSLFSFSWKNTLRKAPKGSGQPVLVIPGFGGADGCMHTLRKYLNKQGYRAYPWLLGRNLPYARLTNIDDVLAYCEKREQQILVRIKEIAIKTGQKVSLVGWSMGGVFANTLAQTHPEFIEQVITLGAPVGNPKSTSTWDLLKYLNLSTVPEEEQNLDGWLFRKNSLQSRQIRSSVIYSDFDGAVSADAAIIDDDLVENIKVKSSHLGFSHNPIVFWVIADRLAQKTESWQCFDIAEQPVKIQQCFNY